MPGCEEKLFCCEDILAALKEVETGPNSEPPWEPGKAGEIGPYQILKGYWIDAFNLDRRGDFGSDSNPRPPAEPAPGHVPGGFPFGVTEVRYSQLEEEPWARGLSIYVICLYMSRYAKAETARLKACKGTLADVQKVSRVHNGGPSQRFESNWISPSNPNLVGIAKKATEYWKKVKKILDC